MSGSYRVGKQVNKIYRLHLSQSRVRDNVLNRMVLPRLMTLIEKHVIDEMTKIVDNGGDVIEAVLKIVQPCQIHNADQLSDWCLSYIANNYNTACRRYDKSIQSNDQCTFLVRFPKVLRGLIPDNQAYLNLNRWPPIWYFTK